MHRSLLQAFKRRLPKAKSLEGQESFEQLLASEEALGVLTDIVGYSLDLDLAVKEQLLRERNVDLRAQLLLDELSRPGTTMAGQRLGTGRFPPDFSEN